MRSRTIVPQPYFIDDVTDPFLDKVAMDFKRNLNFNMKNNRMNKRFQFSMSKNNYNNNQQPFNFDTIIGESGKETFQVQSSQQQALIDIDYELD